MILKKEYRPIIVVIVILLVSVLAFIFDRFDISKSLMITTLWIVFLIALLWAGNYFISAFLDKKLPWDKYLSGRFFIQLLTVLCYSLLCFNLSYFIFKWTFTNDPPSPEQVAMVNIYGSLIVLPIFSIYYVIHFINEWKKVQVKTQLMEKESIKTQYQNLKNHLDPHFLFNNLNILSSLIDIDKESSKTYLTKFAEVYRFMLQTKSSELISLRQEMEFIDAYFQLIATRFQDNLYLRKNLSSSVMEHFLPPMTLQILVENAVKHNSFSKKEPLIIEIEENGRHGLLVRNNIKKPYGSVNSHGSGLNNIRDRYKYFTKEKINVFNDGQFFTISVPLIEIEES